MKFSSVLKNRFKKESLIEDAVKVEQDFEILRKYIPDIFPTESCMGLTRLEIDLAQEVNDMIIAKIKRDDMRPGFIYSEEYLPFHTRDDKWLAKYLHRIIKDQFKQDQYIEKKLESINKNAKKMYLNYDKETDFDEKMVILVDNEKAAKIKMKNILKFVATDKDFNMAREAYEIDMTRAQINYMMTNKKPNETLMHHKYERGDIYSVVTSYNPATSRLAVDADKLFRNAVVEGMTRMGMNKHSVEFGLEKYAPIWRKQMMIYAYYNQHDFEPTQMSHIGMENMDRLQKNLKELWLQQREKQYYEEHKNIVDEANSATYAMKFGEQQTFDLNRQVASLENYFDNNVRKLNMSDDCGMQIK